MRVNLDVVYMPVTSARSKYLAGIQDDLSGQVGYMALREEDLQVVASFSIRRGSLDTSLPHNYIAIPAVPITSRNLTRCMAIY